MFDQVVDVVAPHALRRFVVWVRSGCVFLSVRNTQHSQSTQVYCIWFRQQHNPFRSLSTRASDRYQRYSAPRQLSFLPGKNRGMEGRALATNEAGGAGGFIGGNAAAKANSSVANPSPTNASSISNNSVSNNSSSSSSTADNLQLRKRGREAAYEQSHVAEKKIRDASQDEMGRHYEDDAPPVVGSADQKQAAPEGLAHEPRRQPSVVSETVNAAASGGGPIPANNTVPDQASSDAMALPRLPSGVGSASASASTHGDGGIPAHAVAGAHQALAAVAGAGNAVQNQAAPARRRLRLGFSMAEGMARRVAQRRVQPPVQQVEVASGPASPVDVVSTEMLEILIRDADGPKMVIQGTGLSREYVFGLLLVHPVLYKVDPGTGRAFVLFSSIEDANAYLCSGSKRLQGACPHGEHRCCPTEQ
jgi:hypothetical protein